MKRILLTIGALAFLTGCGGSTKAGLVPSVVSTVPEDSNHVAVVTKWTNPGTKAEADICDIVVNDAGGTRIGDKVDGPADKVAPGASITIRDLIKTSVDTGNVGTVTFTACQQQ